MLCKFNCTSSPPKEFFISHISLSLSLRHSSNRIASHHLPPLHSSLFQDRAGRRILSIVGNLGMEFDPTLRVSFYYIFIVCFHLFSLDQTGPDPVRMFVYTVSTLPFLTPRCSLLPPCTHAPMHPITYTNNNNKR